MLREKASLFQRLAIVTDGVILFAALWFAYLFRGQWGGLQHFHDYLWIALVASLFWYALLSRYRLYGSLRLWSPLRILAALVKVHFYGGLALGAVIFLVTPRDFSRGLFLNFLGFSLLLLAAQRLTLRYGLGFFRRRGYNFRNVLIVGSEKKARRFHELLTEHADWGIHLLGFVQVGRGEMPAEILGHPVFGRIEDLVEICKAHPVDEVVFCPPKSFVPAAETYLRELEELGITVRMVLDFFQISHARTELSLLQDEVPVVTFHSKSFDQQQLFLKRLLDICGGLVGVALTALVFPFIATAIRRDSPGPIFFSQTRIGLSGRPFRCWKFRTMYRDAEARKQELLAQNEMSGAIFKMRNDPRITPVGRFLRRTSLDELPQFWNALRGEMSLVGTRPPTPDEVAQYQNWHRRRISIKPGITGLWQVSGRNRIDDFDEVVRLDLSYIDNWSLWLDIHILFKTLKVVFIRDGSC